LSREIAIEQRLVAEAMSLYRRPQRLVDVIDRAEGKARPTRAEDEWCNHDVNTVETAGPEKARHRVGAALDQHTAQAKLGEPGKDLRWRNMSVGRRQRQNFGVRKLATDAFGGYHDPAGFLTEDARVGRQPPPRIKNNSDRIGALDATNRQLRIIRAHCLDADNYRVDQRP
jgi:hypothetical protein